MNNSERFTKDAKQVILDAEAFCKEYNHLIMEPIHIALACVAYPTTEINNVFLKLNIKADIFSELRELALNTIPPYDLRSLGLNSNLITISNATSLLITKADYESMRNGSDLISARDIFLVCLSESNAAGNLLRKYINEDDFRKELTRQREEELSKHQINSALDQYSTDLVKAALESQLDPVIGRDLEVSRMVEILCRKRKNNVLLVGDAGVGKTALVEGLAQRIANKEVPLDLQNHVVRTLSLTAMMAGATFRGQFEERLNNFIGNVKKSPVPIIVFIDELHTIMGTGNAAGGLDVGNILKPYLARGEFTCIGATTLKEFQQYLEKDGAITRRFQKVLVEEPSDLATLTILRGIKRSYEKFHNVVIKDEALTAAVELSKRYITDRFLPDKAIDIIDEAAARLKLDQHGEPIAIEAAKRNLAQYDLAEASLESEKIYYKKKFINELSEAKQEGLNYIDALKARYEQEKLLVSKLNEIESEENPNVEEIHKLKQAITDLQDNGPLFRNSVNRDCVAEVVSRWTGIPVSKMTSTESKRILELENILRKRVKGQDAALKKIANSIKVAKSGIKDSKKPIGSFLFLGPSGVGKTETAKAIAEALFQEANNIIRIDMSEYGEKHTATRLVGAPPSYVGYEEGGQLTEAVRKKPFSVLLFDEIEKAHPDVLNTLLQIMDDGRLTDGKGRVVDFKNTLIILTSNMGSSDVKEKRISLGASTFVEEDNSVTTTLRRYLRPEFINRLDEIIKFNPLSQDLSKEILEKEIEVLNQVFAQKQFKIVVDELALNDLAANGFSAEFGARPLKRALYQRIQLPLAEMLLQGEIKPDSLVEISFDGSDYTFKTKELQLI